MSYHSLICLGHAQIWLILCHPGIHPIAKDDQGHGKDHGGVEQIQIRGLLPLEIDKVLRIEATLTAVHGRRMEVNAASIIRGHCVYGPNSIPDLSRFSG